MDRLEKILEDSLYQQCLYRNARAEINRKFCHHDFQHMVDVSRITYILMLESGDIRNFMAENGLRDLQQARELIYAAGMLHDIARWKEYAEGVDHSEAGAEIAADLMARYGFSPLEIRIVSQAIRQHRGIDAGVTVLGEKLFRADNLSRACRQCPANAECYKYGDMETGRRLLIY